MKKDRFATATAISKRGNANSGINYQSTLYPEDSMK